MFKACPVEHLSGNIFILQEIKLISEIIVGECVVKSPYELQL